MADILGVLLTLLLLAINAFFVASEFALISARRDRLQALAEQGKKSAVTVIRAGERLSLMLAGAQLGITICSILLGRVGEPAVAHLLEKPFHVLGISDAVLHSVSFVVALVIVVVLHVLLGEMVPKNIALAEPVRSALLLGPPLVALSRALRPVIFTVNSFANGLLKLLRVEPKNEVAATFTDTELAEIVKDATAAGLLDDRAQERLHDALELGSRPVRDVVLPLERVVYASLGVTPAQLEQLSVKTGFSRFPVVDEGRRIVGYLHVKDALDAPSGDEPFRLRDLRPIARIRESTPLDDVLTAMRGSRTHLAAVMGEDGRLAGLVTMEDVLRELFGQRT